VVGEDEGRDAPRGVVRLLLFFSRCVGGFMVGCFLDEGKAVI
jgi:hypothetical protein